jgi:16S rRNA processing protein RimM
VGSAPSSKPPRPVRAPASTSTSSDDRLVVAQVLAAHGIRGELKCRIVTDFPKQRFRRGNTLLIADAPVTVAGARIQGQTVLLRLAEVSDRDAAETLRGKDVLIRQEDAVKLPRGEFYWHEVIGLSVLDATTQQVLGTVVDILETGANDVYVVRSPLGKEILVPAIKDVVKSIDPTSGVMVIEPLAGMLPA